MISIKNKQAIEKMAMAGRLLAAIVEQLKTVIKPGISTLEIDSFVARELVRSGLVSTMKGYMGYKHVTCISINDEVVHGVPSAQKIVKPADVVKVDVCASFKGYCADMARCFLVPPVSEQAQRLVSAAHKALDEGIKKMQPGNRLSDVSAAIEQEVTGAGFGVVRDFAGHGIGKKMHEDPEILNYGKPGQGPLLQVGMAFALEPMITAGAYQVYVDSDGWTVKTKDKSLAAHMEDTVVITSQGPRNLTRLYE